MRCTSTGGRALDMTVSGPGFTSDISSRIQPVGERRWLGGDQYIATTDPIPRGEHGDEYECNVTSSRSQTGRVSVRGKGWSCVQCMIDHILPSLLQWLLQSSVHCSKQLQLLSQWSGHLHSSQLLGTESTTVPPLVEGQVRPSVLMIQPPQLLSSLVSLMNNHTLSQ